MKELESVVNAMTRLDSRTLRRKPSHLLEEEVQIKTCILKHCQRGDLFFVRVGNFYLELNNVRG